MTRSHFSPGSAASATRTALTFGTGLAACLLVAWWALSQGLGGNFIFDDSWNLRGLEAISSDPSWPQAIHYILGGFSSVVGRPLALATFAAQFFSWPLHPEDFIRVNILIHLLNGTLLCWCALLLLRLTDRAGPAAGWIALAIGATWLWAPLQASAVLYVVQRMALLSASCMFAGILLYLCGRLRLARHQHRPALAFMTAGVVLGTGIGVLAKENAILLPLGILIAESTVLRLAPRARLWRPWAVIFLGAPILLVLGYLAWQLPGLTADVQGRGFTPYQRLLSESRILFIYLHKLVLPSLYSIRLLYDDLELSRNVLSPWTTLPSLLAWAALVGAALRYRARAPAFSFGVLWYLAHHLLESTIIPLELAFEHRNYVASVGPVAAGVWYARAFMNAAVAQRLKPVLALAAAGYLAFQITALWQSAELWGRPVDLARYWARAQPESSRAALQLGDSYLAYGDVGSAVVTFERAMDHWPGDPTIPLALMEIGCLIPEGPVPPMSRLEDSLRRFDAQELSLINLLDRLATDMESGGCKRYPPSQIYGIVSMALEMPAFERQRRNLYLIRSRIAEVAGDRAQAMTDLDAALAVQPLIPVLAQATYWSLQGGDVERARRYLAQAQSLHTLNPIKAWAEHRAVKRLEQVVDDYQRQTLESPP